MGERPQWRPHFSFLCLPESRGVTFEKRPPPLRFLSPYFPHVTFKSTTAATTTTTTTTTVTTTTTTIGLGHFPRPGRSSVKKAWKMLRFFPPKSSHWTLVATSTKPTATTAATSDLPTRWISRRERPICRAASPSRLSFAPCWTMAIVGTLGGRQVNGDANECERTWTNVGHLLRGRRWLTRWPLRTAAANGGLKRNPKNRMRLTNGKEKAGGCRE